MTFTCLFVYTHLYISMCMCTGMDQTYVVVYFQIPISVHASICSHFTVCVCVFVCMEWVFTQSGTFPAPLARPAAGRQRLPTHQATLSPGPQSSRGLSKTKLRSLLTPLIPAHSYTTGVEWQNLASEPSKRVVVRVKYSR